MQTLVPVLQGLIFGLGVQSLVSRWTPSPTVLERLDSFLDFHGRPLSLLIVKMDPYFLPDNIEADDQYLLHTGK